MSIAVKICGLSDKKAVETAIVAGADYIGFVHFSASPRHIAFERAAELRTLLPPSIHSVSVMVDPGDALLERAQSILNPGYVQLHGKETPQRVMEICRKFPAMKIIKAVSVQNADDVARAATYYDVADMLMFDAKAPIPPLPRGEGGEAMGTLQYADMPSSSATRYLLPGGNALSFDWNLLKNRQFPLPWFLSGGLTPENVAEAIRISGAAMVDVSSGVESSRGVKDAALIEKIIKAAKHET